MPGVDGAQPCRSRRHPGRAAGLRAPTWRATTRTRSRPRPISPGAPARIACAGTRGCSATRVDEGSNARASSPSRRRRIAAGPTRRCCRGTMLPMLPRRQGLRALAARRCGRIRDAIGELIRAGVRVFETHGAAHAPADRAQRAPLPHLERRANCCLPPRHDRRLPGRHAGGDRRSLPATCSFWRSGCRSAEAPTIRPIRPTARRCGCRSCRASASTRSTTRRAGNRAGITPTRCLCAQSTGRRRKAGGGGLRAMWCSPTTAARSTCRRQRSSPRRCNATLAGRSGLLPETPHRRHAVPAAPRRRAGDAAGALRPGRHALAARRRRAEPGSGRGAAGADRRRRRGDLGSPRRPPPQRPLRAPNSSWRPRNDGGASLRFGDGRFGKGPAAGARYRARGPRRQRLGRPDRRLCHRPCRDR